MKRVFYILTIIAQLSSCAPEQEVIQKEIPLSAPELSCEGNCVDWTSVENARAYEMDINGRIISLTSDVQSYN